MGKLFALSQRTAADLRRVLQDGGSVGGRTPSGAAARGLTWVKVTDAPDGDGWHPGVVSLDDRGTWTDLTTPVLVAADDGSELTADRRYPCTRTGDADGTARFRTRPDPAPRPRACAVRPPGFTSLLGHTAWVGLTGAAIRLPVAGTYSVSWSCNVTVKPQNPNDFPSCYVLLRLYDCGGGTHLAQITPASLPLFTPGLGEAASSGRVFTVRNHDPAAVEQSGTISDTQLVTVYDAPTDLQLQAGIMGFGAPGDAGWLHSANVSGVWLHYVLEADAEETGCDGEGCAEEGGSGSDGGSDGGDGEHFIDLGATVGLTISGTTGDCGCLDGYSTDLAIDPGDSTRWGPATIDTSGCPEVPPGGVSDHIGVAWAGDGWRLIGLYDGLDCTFVSQDDATKTVVFRCTATAGVGDSVCSGTFLVTVVGS